MKLLRKIWYSFLRRQGCIMNTNGVWGWGLLFYLTQAVKSGITFEVGKKCSVLSGVLVHIFLHRNVKVRQREIGTKMCPDLTLSYFVAVRLGCGPKHLLEIEHRGVLIYLYIYTKSKILKRAWFALFKLDKRNKYT